MKKETKEVQFVDVYVDISGDYCAFHEMGFSVLYDVTNNKSLEYNDKTLEELENWDGDNDYSDIEMRRAVLIDGQYWVEW